MAYDIIIGRDKSDLKRFGNKGLVYIGKGYVKMGNYTSLSNMIWLDVARSHVVMIAGKRGSGKSYTLGAIAEELCDLPEEVSQNIAPIIFDTMGIFWTMKYKNEKEAELLQDWDLKPKNLPATIWAPYGHFAEYEKRNIPVDKKFAIKASELSAEDWVITFNLQIIDPISIIIERVVSELIEAKNDFDIEDIIESIKNQKQSDEKARDAAIALFEAAETWKVFAKRGQKGTEISELLVPGSSTVLDVSVYSSIGTFNVRALVIGLVCKKLFNERMLARKKEEMIALQHGMDYLNAQEKKEVPLVWLFIDEAHEFLPKEGKTAASDALIQILREGRQPGISLVMATQQPGVIHRDAMTQSDVVIAHRLTAQPDIEALNSIMQTYLLESIRKSMQDLPSLKGSALILDDNSERIYPIRVRPRFTWHGGEAPTAIRIKKEI
jgi:ABC-type dipeptide/oligopeptide/nickel transport system ATPase component